MSVASTQEPAPGLAVQVLGGLRVSVDGRPVPMRGAIRRRLLLTLLASPGGLSPDLLAEAIWPGAGAGSVKTLQVHIFRLRRELDPDGDRARRWLAMDSNGYRLAPDYVDLHAVEQQLDAAEAQVGAAPDQAAIRLRALLDEIHEPAHEDIPAWQARLRRLDQRVRVAQETWAGILVDMGTAGARADDILELARAEPTREARWVLAMRALAQAGRTRDALAAYTEARTLLIEEWGIEPCRELHQCQQALLRAGGLGASRPGARWQAASPVPRPVTGFVGRQEALDRLTRAVGRHRIVTVHGLGGVGKTRLVTEWIHRSGHASACHWIDVRGVHEGDLARRVAVGLGLLPPDGVGASPVDAILFGMGQLPVIVVLDNADEVPEEAAALCASMALALPQVTLVVTSRTPLGISGERPILLAPLAADEALELASERMSGDTDSNAASVVQRSGGLPLAIELLAANPHALETVSDRHGQRPLAEIVRASLDQLSPEADALLARLRQLPGGAGATLIDLLAGGRSPRQRLLRELVGASLVTTETRPSASGPALQYRVLQPFVELPGIWGHEQEDAAVAFGAFGTWVGEQLRTGYDAVPLSAGIRAVAADWPNLDAALHYWADHEPRTVLRLSAGLLDLFGWLGRATEGHEVLSNALTRAAEASPVERAGALAGSARGGGLALFASRLDQLDEAISLLENAGRPDPALACMTHTFRGAGRAWVGRRAEALADLTSAHHYASAAASPWLDANVRQLDLAMDILDPTKPDPTDGFLEVSDAFLAIGDPHAAAVTAQTTLTVAAVRNTGRHAELLARVRELAELDGSPMVRALVGQEVARAATTHGQPAWSPEVVEAIETLERSGNHRTAALARRDLGLALLKRGERVAAGFELSRAAAILGRLDPGSAALAAAGLAAIRGPGAEADRLAALAWACAGSGKGTPLGPEAQGQLAALAGTAPASLPDGHTAGDALRAMVLDQG